jgi:hypothetical protein
MKALTTALLAGCMAMFWVGCDSAPKKPAPVSETQKIINAVDADIAAHPEVVRKPARAFDPALEAQFVERKHQREVAFDAAAAAAMAAAPPKPMTPLQGIHHRVALDAERAYNDARASEASTSPELCARASLVAEAYLQADEPETYRQWQRTRNIWCQ